MCVEVCHGIGHSTALPKSCCQKHIRQEISGNLLKCAQQRMDLTKSTKHGPSSVNDLDVPVSLKCGGVC